MTTPGSADTTTTDTEPATSGTSASGASAPQDAAAVDAGPDATGPSSVHVPGQAPGLSVLPGPASMTIGGPKPRKRGGRKSS